MREAVKRAQALEFIERKFKGLRPRRRTRAFVVRWRAPAVSIARALLKDPPILILDERPARSTPTPNPR